MNENEAVIDGVKYVAKESYSGCIGCAGDGDDALCEELHRQCNSCCADGREAHRDVIFVKAEE